METSVNFINSADEILNILDTFSYCLYSLESGSVDKSIVAEKFATVGKFIELSNNNETIGFAAFYCNDNEHHIGFLSMIAVLPKYRHMGMGKKIMDIVCEVSRKNGMKSCMLQVRKDNIAACAFYKDLGFEFTNQVTEDSYYMCIVL